MIDLEFRQCLYLENISVEGSKFQIFMTGKILKTDDEDKILNHPEKKIHIE